MILQFRIIKKKYVMDFFIFGIKMIKYVLIHRLITIEKLIDRRATAVVGFDSGSAVALLVVVLITINNRTIINNLFIDIKNRLNRFSKIFDFLIPNMKFIFLVFRDNFGIKF